MNVTIPWRHLRAGWHVKSLALFAALLAAGDGLAGDDDDVQAVPAVAVVGGFNDENFDQWVFQNDGNAAMARKRLDALLTLQVDDVDRACHLTETQKKKLLLAGRGDIKRFFDKCDVAKRKFDLVKHDQQKFQEIWQDISPLQVTLQAGLFHDNSLVYRTLKNTLTEEQRGRYDAIAADRRAFRFRAKVELAVTMLEQSLPLRETQRRELIALILKDAKPRQVSTQYDFYLVMYELSRIPEEKLKALLDDTQWKGLEKQMAQYKQIIPALRQQGQLPDDDDGDKEKPKEKAGGAVQFAVPAKL